MRPVDQTSFGILDGNCFSACIASILEVPLGAVPYFWGPRHALFTQWLREQDLAAVLHPRIVHVPSGYSIEGGPSLRFAGSACVALDGVVVHDPHPSREGLPLGIVERVMLHAISKE